MSINGRYEITYEILILLVFDEFLISYSGQNSFQNLLFKIQ